VKLVLSLYCGCSLQGTCTVDWSYIAYCHSSILSLMCYLLYVRTGLFLLCGGVFCTLYIATVCLVLHCWKKVSDCAEFGWFIVLLVAGSGYFGAKILGLFCGYWSFIEASKILLGAILYSSFKWLLMENFFVKKVTFSGVEEGR